MTKDEALKIEESDFKNHSKQQLFEYIVYLREELLTRPAPSWQGLSDDEIGNCFDEVMIVDEISSEFTPINFARAIEQALKENNHG